MWRVTVLAKAAAGLDAAQAFRGLLEDYAPSLLADPVLGGQHLRKLAVAVACAPTDSGLPQTFDVGTELWFDEEAAAARALLHLSQNEELKGGADRYFAAEETLAWMGEYFPNLELDGVKLKVTVTGDVADGIGIPEALQYWRDVHPVVARTAKDFWAHLRLYAQVHGRRVPGVATYRPMAADIGFANAGDFAAAFSHPQYLSIVRPDEIKFSKPGNMFAFASLDRRTLLDRH
jgi:hypothetical protein